MDLEETGINVGNWVDSAQDRNYWRAPVNVALNLRVSKASQLSNQQEKEIQEGPGVEGNTMLEWMLKTSVSIRELY